MQVVPVQAIPNQGLQVTLAGQQVALNIFQTNYGAYMSVFSNGSAVVQSVICQDVNRIVRDTYLGFQGDFCWFDTTGGGEDPVFTGFGSRFLLIYLEEADLA
jgi:hypothetical protein